MLGRSLSRFNIGLNQRSSILALCGAFVRLMVALAVFRWRARAGFKVGARGCACLPFAGAVFVCA